MTSKFTHFFDTMQGKSSRQINYETIYLDNGVDLEPILQEAYNMTLDDSTKEAFRGRGFMSYHMNWNMIGLLKRYHPDKMDIDKCGRDYFRLKDGTRIYLKKLNSHYAPDNIKTAHVEELNSMFLQLGLEPVTILYAGLKIESNKNWNKLDGFYLVEMKDLKRTNWVTDLAELSHRMKQQSSTKVSPITTILLPDDIIVTPKNNSGNMGKTSEG